MRAVEYNGGMLYCQPTAIISPKTFPGMLVMREHSVAVGLIFKDELLDINTFTRCEDFLNIYIPAIIEHFKVCYFQYL